MEELPYNEETARALKLFVRLSRCYVAVTERVRRDISRHKLTPSEFGVLELLYHKGPLPLGEVAGRILLTTGSITYVLDQLASMGLVARIPCQRDRRRSFASLTEEGRTLIAGVFPEHAEEIRETMSVLSQEEQETLGALLKKLGHTSARWLHEANAIGSPTCGAENERSDDADRMPRSAAPRPGNNKDRPDAESPIQHERREDETCQNQ